MSKGWKEGEDRLIPMPEDEPEIVKLYIQWLYTQKFFIRWTQEADRLEHAQHLPEFFTLAHLYVLGEKCCDISFKNAVVAAFIRRISISVHKSKWFPISKVVDIIYSGTPSTSPLRRLMIDGYLSEGNAEWLGAPLEEHNSEFVLELTRAIYTRIKQRNCRFSDLTFQLNAAKYMENDQGAV